MRYFLACLLLFNSLAYAETIFTNVTLTNVTANQNPMVQREGSKFIKDGEPFYFVGVNCYRLIYTWIQDQVNGTTNAEDYFDQWVADGVKVVRVIMYVLGDAALTDPPNAPTAVAINGGSLTNGKTYVYRYAAGNYSKTASTYEQATTLCSPITSIAITSPNQSVKLTLPYVDNAYIYTIYRRESTDAVDSEELLDTVYVVEGLDVNYIDSGTGSPSGAIPATNNTQDNPRLSIAGQTNAFMTGIGNYNESKFVAWDNILELAREHDIMIMPCLVDRQDNLTGGVKDFMLQAGRKHTGESAAGYRDDEWALSCRVLEWYKDWLTHFIGRTNTVNNRRYKDDPSIFAWELMNEPWGIGTNRNFRSWMTKIIEHIKSIDDKHLIGIGGTGEVLWQGTAYSGGVGNWTETHDFIAHSCLEGIDYCSWHIKPNGAPTLWGGGGYDGHKTGTDQVTITEFKEVMQTKANWAGSFLRKPIIFGELNMNDWTDADDWIPEISQAILDIRATQKLGDNLVDNYDFSNGLTGWTYTSKVVIDTDKTYKQKQTCKVEKTSGGDYTPDLYQIIDVTPNTDYWYKIIYCKEGEYATAFGDIFALQVRARVNVGDSWTSIDEYYLTWDETVSGYNEYWANMDLNRASYGKYKWNSGNYTQVRFAIESNSTAYNHRIWVAEAEFRPYLVAGSDTVYGGICWWAWPELNFDKDNATVRQQLRDAAALY